MDAERGNEVLTADLLRRAFVACNGELAWGREDAIEVVKHFMTSGVAIVHGEQWSVVDGTVRAVLPDIHGKVGVYSWWVEPGDRRESESWNEYCLRSGRYNLEMLERAEQIEAEISPEARKGLMYNLMYTTRKEDEFRRFPNAMLRSMNGKHRFRISACDYGSPEVKDPDWQRNRLWLDTPGFRAEIDDAMIAGHDLEEFHKVLRDFIQERESRVEYDPSDQFYALIFEGGEGDFRLGISCSSKRAVLVNGYVAHEGSRLTFQFETFLDYLNVFAEGIGDILKRFPPASSCQHRIKSLKLSFSPHTLI